MSAIRHGREVLPASRPVPADTRYRCGWCPFVGTRDDVDAHEEEHLAGYDDGGPCCAAVVTSGGADHEPGCPA